VNPLSRKLRVVEAVAHAAANHNSVVVEGVGLPSRHPCAKNEEEEVLGVLLDTADIQQQGAALHAFYDNEEEDPDCRADERTTEILESEHVVVVVALRDRGPCEATSIHIEPQCRVLEVQLSHDRN
jgi:hypothetical protein